MIKKFIVLTIVCLLYVNSQEFLDKEKKHPDDDYFNKMQEMLVSNLKSSLDLYHQHSLALEEFTERIPAPFRKLQLGNCSDCIPPKDLDCPCVYASSCCSGKCISGRCAPA